MVAYVNPTFHIGDIYTQSTINKLVNLNVMLMIKSGR